MARFNEQLSRGLGLAALGIVLGAAGAGIVPLLAIGWSDGANSFTPYLWQVLRFTLLQASLSTLLSLLLGLLAARTLARRQFPGRSLLLRLMLLPQALPAIVVVFSLLALLGNSGLLPNLFPIYGLSGILLAHVFFNMPLAARMLLTRYETIAIERHRLADQLHFNAWERFRHVEWPVIASTVKSAGGLIFLLCAASFAVVLVLGGGPQATTLEVAIFQALRMDFNPGFAALLSLVQVALFTFAIFVTGRTAMQPDLLPSRSRPVLSSIASKSAMVDALVLSIIALILIPPLVALFISGIAYIQLSKSLWLALLTSGIVGVCAAAIATLLGGFMATLSARSNHALFRSLLTLASLACLLLPPAVIATGWFIILAPRADVTGLAPVLVVLLNALVALPFVRALLEPALAQSFAVHDRLCDSLGMTGFDRLRLVELPVLRRPLMLAATMAFIMSLGDLAAITLFGNSDFVTLPALIYRQMGHYEINEAGGTALVLALSCAALTLFLTPRESSDDQG